MSFPVLDQQSVAAFGVPFPLEDSQYFQDWLLDPAIKKETDGGIVYSRRRYLRVPAKMIITGFSALPHNFKSLLDAFWAQTGFGGAASFNYIHPLDGNTIPVRFDDVFTTAYKGLGSDKVWEITNIKLRSL